jgi:hypothetical protein
MTSVVEDVKNLVVYFDHGDLFGEVNWDDVVANPMSDLPNHQPMQSVVCGEESYTKVSCFLHKFGEHKSGSSC